MMFLGCGTAYYHNYQVNGSLRHYYGGNIPAVIQVGEHQFVEHRVIKMWCTDTNISWYGSFIRLTPERNLKLNIWIGIGNLLPTVLVPTKFQFLIKAVCPAIGLFKMHSRESMFMMGLQFYLSSKITAKEMPP
jgi:hypothetical protein